MGVFSRYWLLFFAVMSRTTTLLSIAAMIAGEDSPTPRTTYFVFTESDIRSAVNASTDASTIVVCANITLSETLQIMDKPDIVFQSSPGNHFFLSGRSAVQIMLLAGLSRVSLHNLTLFEGYMTGDNWVDAGGAINVNGENASLLVTGSDFVRCRADYGGAVGCVLGASCILRAVRFIQCRADLYGGAAAAYGDHTSLSFWGTIFKACVATEFAGGAVVVTGHSRADFTDSSFLSCSAGIDGGAIYMTTSYCNFTRTAFTGNEAQTGSGGSIYAKDSGLDFAFCTFADSCAYENGGTIFAIGQGSLAMYESMIAGGRALWGNGAGIYRVSFAAVSDVLVLSGCSFTNCTAPHGNGAGAFVSGRIAAEVNRSSFVHCGAERIGGAVALSSAGTDRHSTFSDSRFVDCFSGEKGGALALVGNSASDLQECEFVRCRVEVRNEMKQCMLLTMKSLNHYAMWSGAVLFFLASDEYARLPTLLPEDLACSSANNFCTYDNPQTGRNLCKCQCNSNAEAILTNKSIASFTMACAPGEEDQLKTFCVDKETHGSSYEVVVTSGAYPFAVEWTLGENISNPATYIADGLAEQIRSSIEPFKDSRTASSGYGGGAIYVNNSAVVRVSSCSFVDTAAKGSFGGGAIYVESAQGSVMAAGSDPVNPSALQISSSTFQGTSASLGTAIFNSLANVTFVNSYIATDGRDDAFNAFFDSDQSAECRSECPMGEFGNCTVAGHCSSCSVGVCLACPPGRQGTIPGATSLEQGCLQCQAGYAKSGAGRQSCFVCPSGKFSADAFGASTTLGAVKCESCPPSTYVDVNGSSSCLECDSDRDHITSVSGSSRCDRALEGYYIDPSASAIEPIARKCPSNARCPGGLVLPLPKKDFWLDPSVDNNAMEKIYKCKRNTCKGAKLNISCWTTAEAHTKQCNVDDILCKKGSYGPLCGSCSLHYTFNAISSSCESCNDPSTYSISEIMVLSFFIFAAAFFIFYPKKRLQGLCGKIVSYFRGFNRGSLKIGWNTFQVVGSISYSNNGDFPEPFLTWRHLISFMSFDFLNSECFFSHQSYFRQVYIVAFLPVIAAVIIIMTFVLVARQRPHLNHRIKHRWLPYTLLLLSYLILPPIMAKIFISLDCISINGAKYLRNDTSIQCDSAAFHRFQAIAGILISVYLLIPLIWCFLIYRISKQLNPTTRNYATFEEDTAALRLLLVDYRQGFEFTECFEMYRRIFFIGIIPLVSQNDETKCFIGMLFASISIFIYNETAPFKVPFNNIIAKVAQYVVLFTYGFTAAIASGVSDSVNSTIIGLLLLALSIFFLFLIVYFTARRERTSASCHFFLCYNERNTSDQSFVLEKALRDKHFRVSSMGDGVKEVPGVEGCKVLILFLNAHTLGNREVQSMLAQALMLQKRIVLVRETSALHGAPIDDDGIFNIEHCCSCDPICVSSYRKSLENQYKQEGMTREDVEGLVAEAFPPLANNLRTFIEGRDIRSEIIPYNRQSPFREAMVAIILEEAAMMQRIVPEVEDREEMFLLPRLPPMPNYFSDGRRIVRYHTFVACSVTGLAQRHELVMLLNARWGLSVFEADSERDDGLDGVGQSSSMVIFLTDYVLTDSKVQTQIREAKILGLPIVLVHETEKGHGAPLDCEDKKFDFARVLREQAPEDLRAALPPGIDSIPYHRRSPNGFDRLADAMLYLIVKRLGAALVGQMVDKASEERSSWSTDSMSFTTSVNNFIRMQDFASTTMSSEIGHSQQSAAVTGKMRNGSPPRGGEVCSPLLNDV